MRGRSVAVLVVALWALLALPALRAYAGSPEEITAAIALYDDLEYEQAIVALDAALAQPGLTPAQVASEQRYRLLSFVALGREADARAAARALLAVDRDYELPRTESQRALDLLSEERAALPAVVVEARPVTLTQSASPATPKRGTPVVIRATVSDPGARSQRVVVHHRIRGEQGYSTMRARRLGPGSFEAVVPGAFVRAPALEYYVVAEDAAGTALASQGSATEPLQVTLARGKKGGSVLGKWWFWAAVGGLAIVGTGAVLLAGDDGGGGSTDATVTVTVNLMP